MEEKQNEDTEPKEVRERMTKLLKQGNKLLAEYCPKCGTPLFLIKDKGLKYCPKCQVYLATEEEIEEKEIDTTKEKIYDFDKFWKQEGEKEKKEIGIKEPVEKRKTMKRTSQEKEEVLTKKAVAQEKLERKTPGKVNSSLDTVLATLLHKLSIKIEERELSSEKILEWIERLAKIRSCLKEKNVE